MPPLTGNRSNSRALVTCGSAKIGARPLEAIREFSQSVAPSMGYPDGSACPQSRSPACSWNSDSSTTTP